MQVKKIFTEPPEVNVLTDQDSDYENGAGAVDNLSVRHLLAPAEIMLENNEIIGGYENSGLSTSPTLLVTPVNTSRPPKMSHTSTKFPLINNDDFIIQKENWVENRKKPTQKWITGDFDDRVQDFPKPHYNYLSNKTSMELFELFFTDEIIDLLVKETKKIYFVQKF